MGELPEFEPSLEAQLLLELAEMGLDAYAADVADLLDDADEFVDIVTERYIKAVQRVRALKATLKRRTAERDQAIDLLRRAIAAAGRSSP